MGTSGRIVLSKQKTFSSGLKANPSRGAAAASAGVAAHLATKNKGKKPTTTPPLAAFKMPVSSVEPTLRPSVVLADEPTQPQVEPERVTGSGGRPKSASREGSMVTDRI